MILRTKTNKTIRKERVEELIVLTIAIVAVIMFFGGLFLAGAAIDAEVMNWMVFIPSCIATLIGGVVLVYFSIAYYRYEEE